MSGPDEPGDPDRPAATYGPDPGNAPPWAWSEPQSQDEGDEVMRRLRAIWKQVRPDKPGA